MLRWLDRLLLTCTGVLVLAHLLPLGARLSWLIELTAHFRMQYLGATAVLLAALAVRAHWRAFVVLVAAGAVSGAAVAPYLPIESFDAASAAAESRGERIRVLTVNISFQQFSGRRLLEVVGEAAPDVVVAQELTPYAAEVLAELDKTFVYHLKMPADGAYGIAVWSRLELESTELFALGRRPAIEARVRSPSGTFTLIGVHLNAPTSPARAAARNRELEQLAARSASIMEPLVVAGDFNITPYSPFFRAWLDASGLTDSRRHRTLSVSWPVDLPVFGIPIDHVAVSPQFLILSHRRLPNFGSDHYGVLVDLALQGEGA
jgi:endonuclease/exonuclease/phosphatase (EEP) superfamily protein YafD